MEKRGTMAVKEGHVERERWEERTREKKPLLKYRQGRADLREMGKETVFVITHIPTHTHTNILSLFRVL